MDVLIMTSGKEVKVASVTHDDFLNIIHCKVCDMTISEIAELFSDESETSTMIYGSTIYEGYIFLKAISPMSGWTNVMMGKTR